MYRHFLPPVILMLFTSVSAWAQTTSGAGLATKLDALQALVPTEVTAAKDLIDQKLSYEAATPYLLTVTQVEGTGKRVSTTVAKVNLALVRRVRIGDGRGSRLPVTVFGNAENILVGEPDGGRQSYEGEFDLLASNTDNARAIVALLEEILPLAKSKYEELSQMPADAPGLRAFIAERIHRVASGKDDYTQTLTFDEATGSGTLSLSGSGTREAKIETVFIVGDMQDRGIKLDNRSGLVTLTVPARSGREYVQVSEDGELSFDDEVVLRFDDYGEAQLVNDAFGKLIVLADERSKATASLFGTTASAGAALEAAFAKTDIIDTKQTFTGECAASLELSTSGRSSSLEVFDFHFADFDPRGVEVKPRKGYVSLVLNTRDKDPFVKHVEEGELKGFDRSAELRFSSALAARDALAAIEYLTEKCPPAVGKVSLADATASATIPRFGEGEDEQVFAKADKECVYVLTLVERTGSKVKETQTTFSLKDLDPRASAVKVQGSKAYVNYGARRGERIIDVVRDGGDQRYEDELSIRFLDVQTAREFKAAFEEAINGCTD